MRGRGASKRAKVMVRLSDGHSHIFRLNNVQKQLAASSATDAAEDTPTAEGVGEAVAVDTEGVGEAAAVPTEGSTLSSAKVAVELDDMLDEHWLSKRDSKKEGFGDEGIGAEGEHGGESEPKGDDVIADGETAAAATVAQPGAFAPGAYATYATLHNPSKAVQITQCGPLSVVATVLSLELESVNLPLAVLTAVDKVQAARLVKESVVVGGKTIKISGCYEHSRNCRFKATLKSDKVATWLGNIPLGKMSISEGLSVAKKIIGDMKDGHCEVTPLGWYGRRDVHQIRAK